MLTRRDCAAAFAAQAFGGSCAAPAFVGARLMAAMEPEPEEVVDVSSLGQSLSFRLYEACSWRH